MFWPFPASTLLGLPCPALVCPALPAPRTQNNLLLPPWPSALASVCSVCQTLKAPKHVLSFEEVSGTFSKAISVCKTYNEDEGGGPRKQGQSLTLLSGEVYRIMASVPPET